MKWKKYGITLQKITESDIELVRTWRNSDKIKQNMQFREFITPEMQKKWFDSINNINNFYYLIIYHNEKIGLINNKNVDWESRTSEAGIFLWNDSYEFAPWLASILLCEIGFYFLEGWDSVINVLKDNKHAIEYNIQLGYEPIDDNANSQIQTFRLTKKNFEIHTKKLREAGLKLSLNDPNLYLIFEKHDYETGVAQYFENLMKTFNIQHKCEIGENEEKIFSCIL